MTSSDGFQLGHLCPNYYNQQTLEKALANIRTIEDYLETPLVLEYITYTVRIPGSSWTPEEFYLELVHRHHGLGVLLDLSNVWYNGLNFGFDYVRFISDLPQDRIVQIHLAGGVRKGGMWQDSHSMPIHEEVFVLLDKLCQSAAIDTIIIERDSNYDNVRDDLRGDLTRTRTIWQKGSLELSM